MPQFVYYTSADSPGLLINLYTASEGEFSVGSNTTSRVKIRQETNYPYDGKVTIHLSADETFPLKLRIPRWAASESPSATVNGQSIDVTAGEWLIIDRKWGKDDVVELNLPMTWRLIEGRKSQEGRFAVMRGPLVFGFNPVMNADALKYVDMQVLNQVTLDPEALAAAKLVPMTVDGHTFYGVTFEGWRPGWLNGPRIDEPGFFHAGFVPKVPLVFTEFGDPGTRAIYFKAFDKKGVAAVADELLASESQNASLSNADKIK